MSRRLVPWAAGVTSTCAVPASLSRVSSSVRTTGTAPPAPTAEATGALGDRVTSTAVTPTTASSSTNSAVTV